MNRIRSFALCAAALTVGAAAEAGYVITQGTSAPTYTTTLNFDEPGGPTGSVAPDAFLASHGITELQNGNGAPFVGDLSGGFPWVGSSNTFDGTWGVFMKFDSDLSEFSAQVWDPSGNPSPFGGGFGVFLFNDNAEVGSYFGAPAWGGIGDEWVNIATSAGSTFDEIRILGFGFFPTTVMDNASWNAVPEPGSLTLLGLAALPLLRRRG